MRCPHHRASPVLGLLLLACISGCRTTGPVIRLVRPAPENAQAKPKKTPLTLIPCPNPALGTVRLHFVVPRTSMTVVAVYDLRGRRMRELVHGRTASGLHEVEWKGDDRQGRRVAGGTYLARLQTTGRSVTSPLTLLH